MVVQSIGSFELNKIKFQEQDLLDVVDSMRSQGLGQHVSLPQLIVCGDQSAGKSSVLEAFSGIPFPTNDGLCTVFATEMILRKADDFNVTVRISPDPDTASTRSEAGVQRLLSFGGTYDKSADFQAIIDNAKDAMGISKGKTFSNDRLRIEVSGPDLTSLTIVDLPGLFHAGENSDPVQNMVRKYMENPRSVILAVVSAKNDVANQIVLKHTKEFDPSGSRTIGIITKPDTLSVGSANESKILSLVRNEDPLFTFRYGWHVLKNRSFEEADTSSKERDDAESTFFSQGLWKGVSRSLVGISTLRPRLNSLLLTQIKNELPKLIGDIEVAERNHLRDLEKLGDSRVTVDEQRAYLIKISQSFQSIVNAAVDGSYSKVFFKDARSSQGYNRRLRAVVQNLNHDFEEEMRLKGHQFNIIDHVTPSLHSRSSSVSSSSSSAAPSSPSPPPSEPDASKPTSISRDDFLETVMKLLKRSRGRELPGMFNPMIVADLFKEQSEPWKELCNHHVEVVIDATLEFLNQTISHLADDKVAERLLQEVVAPNMNQLTEGIADRLKQVLQEDLHPITLNHYFTDNFQEIKAKRQHATTSAVISKFLGVDSDSREAATYTFNPSALIAALTGAQKEPDMDKFAASELIDYMEAYYKVALKNTVDNVAVQVVEESLIQRLKDILSPISVGEMNAITISRIAGESHESRVMREELQKALKVLHEGLDTCKPFASLTKKGDLHHSAQDKLFI